MNRGSGRSRKGLSAVLLSTLSCGAEPPDEVLIGDCVPEPALERDEAGLIRCDLVPELCDQPLDSEIREPDLETAIDIVFLGDGFSPDEMELFREDVARLVDGARSDPGGILGRDPDLFNIHRVNLASTGHSPTARALRSCSRPDGLLAVDSARVERAAANAPDADVIVVVARGSGGRPNAPGAIQGEGRLLLGEDHSHLTLTHELGHALFGLGDEYTEIDELHPLVAHSITTSSPRLRPNVSLDPGEGWGGAYAGTVEGAELYSRGVYRPTDSCRMLRSQTDEHFCPVCSDHIDRWLRARRGVQDGEPFCAVDAEGAPPVGGGCGFLIRAWDGNGLAAVRFSMDRVPPFEVDLLSPEPRRTVFLQAMNVPSVPAQVAVYCEDTLGQVSTTTLSATELGGLCP
jgi:hypothetical protein